MFFYLGAKFGRTVFDFDDVGLSSKNGLLPNDTMVAEIEEKLKNSKHEFTFHDVLLKKKALNQKVEKSPNLKAPVINSQKVSKPVQIKEEPKVVKKVEPKPVPQEPVAEQIKTKEGMVVKFLEPTVISDHAIALKPDTKFHIQLGEYDSKQAARDAADVWIQKGIFAKVVPVDGAQNTYKIQVGQFKTINKAMHYQNKLAQDQNLNGRIVYAEK